MLTVLGAGTAKNCLPRQTVFLIRLLVVALGKLNLFWLLRLLWFLDCFLTVLAFTHNIPRDYCYVTSIRLLNYYLS
jgi:hypothetical protein